MNKDLMTQQDTSNDDFAVAIDSMLGSLYEPIMFYDKEHREEVETNDFTVQQTKKGILGAICWKLQQGLLHSDMDMAFWSDVIAERAESITEIGQNRAAFLLKMYKQAEIANAKLSGLLDRATDAYVEAFDESFPDWKVQPQDWKIEKDKERRHKQLGEASAEHEPCESTTLELSVIAEARRAKLQKDAEAKAKQAEAKAKKGKAKTKA